MPKKIKEAFPKIKKIAYEGPDSKNPLAFKYYNEDEKVEGKSMKDHLRFSVVYWHTFRNPLADPFGVGTALRPWDDGTDSVKNAQNRGQGFYSLGHRRGDHPNQTEFGFPAVGRHQARNATAFR